MKIYFALFALLAAGSATFTARAATFCVADGVQLRQALTVAASNSAPDQIRLVSGLYVSSSTFTYSTDENFSIELSGGWTSNCLIEKPDAARSVLDGQGEHRVLEILPIAPSANVVVRNLTIRHGDTSGANSGGSGGGARIGGAAGFAGSVTIDRVDFYGNRSGYLGGGLDVSTGGLLTIRNSVFRNNSVSSIGNFGALLAFCTGITASIENNTVAFNAGDDGGAAVGGIGVRGSAAFRLRNNILYANVGLDASFPVNGPIAMHNDIGTYTGGIAAASAGNVSADPEFVDIANLRLSPSSPLIDSGYANAVGQFDIDGKTRVDGAGVDLGAYEWSDSIFRDSLE
jgi:hypothetical protein